METAAPSNSPALPETPHHISATVVLAEARYHRGLVYRDLGEPEQAISDFGAAVELEPNYGLARHALG